MTYRKKSDYAPHISPHAAQACQMAGCKEPGVYKAPKSKEELEMYQWFCLEHIRQHNQQWDFFDGLSEGEIEAFIRDATYGHRPTWSRESRIGQRQQKLQDALYEFLNPGKPAPKPTPPLAAKMRKALAMMEMEYPYTAQSLKARYRSLVKKYHPDMNKGNKESEEKFKQITAAYHYLSEEKKEKK